MNKQLIKRMLRLVAMILTICATGSAWAGTGPVAYTEASGYSRWSYSRIINWRVGNPSSNNKQDLATATVTELAANGTTEMDADGNTSTGYAMGWNDTSTSSGKRFNSGSTPYASGGTADGPGYVLRFSGAGGTDYRAYADATFYPLTFGGLIVEPGATGYSITSSGANNYRHIEFGSKAGTETWFVINEPFTISRYSNWSATAYFYGTINLLLPEVTDVFTLSIQNNIYMSTPSGTSVYPELKFHGAGQLEVNQPLQATGNATLNFANVTRDVDEDGSFDDEDAFIDGDLTIDSSTKFVFPSTLAANTAYPLCTGTLSGAPEAGITSVKIGNTTKNVRLTFSGNKVSYVPVYTATVNGAEISWDEEPESLDNVVLHVTGSGEATGLSGSGTIIYADSGSTVDVTSFTSPTLNGSGIFRYTSGYPTTVPSNYTYEYVGGDTESAEVEITDALKVSGTLRIKGYVYLNSTGTDFYSGSTVEIVSGQTKADTYRDAWYSGGFAGTVTIDPDATFVVMRNDTLKRNASNQVVFNVYGTLKFNSTRWTVQAESVHLFNFYPGAKLTGSGDGSGTLDFEVADAGLNVYNVNKDGSTVANGVVTFEAPIRVRGNAVSFNIANNTTLELAAEVKGDGTIVKNGEGTLKFKNIGMTLSVSGSEGTVELYNNSGSNITHTGTMTFSGKLKVVRDNSSYSHHAFGNGNLGDTSNTALILTGFPSLEIAGTNPYMCLNRQISDNYIAVRNLTAVGTSSGAKIDAVYNGSGDNKIKTVRTKQTEATTCNMAFNGDNNGRRAALYVFGENATVCPLTLTGDSTTYGPLDIHEYGKVIFAGSGAWKNGTVTVYEHGEIESRSSAASIANSLVLQEGSKIALYDSTPINANSVTIPDGVVYVDMSAFGLADDATATIISATTLTGGANVGNLQSTTGLYTFAVGAGGNTIEATNLSSCIWDGDSWSREDPSLYSDVTVNVAEGGTTLTLDKDYSFDSITLSGSSGTLTIDADGHTLTVGDIVIPEGVTLTSSSALTITGVVSGDGCLVVEGENLSVYDAKTWTVNSIVVNGTLTLGGENSSISGTVTGAGKIVYPTRAFPSVTGLNAAGWTGEVDVPVYTPEYNWYITFNNLGNAGSTVVLKGVPFGAYWGIGAQESGETVINPTVQIDGNVTFTYTYSSTTFSQVTGAGDLNFDPYNTYNYRWNINTLTNYSGTLGVYASGSYNSALSIGTLALAEGVVPTLSDRLVKIKSGSDWANIINVENIVVTVGGEATEYKLIKKNVGMSTAGLYLAPAVIKNGSTLTPYDSVSDAISAIGPYTTYDYVIVNESAAISQNTMSLKLKKGFESVVLTVNTAYSEYTPVPAESSGVITYTLTPTQTTYTWASTLASGVWNTSNPSPWRYGASVQANRAPTTCDDIRFATDATITVNEDISVYSITNSTNVVFSTTATPTVAANAEGGIVLSAAGASFTVPVGMTLSPTPTTDVEGYYVKRTTGSGTTTYTAVLAIASAVINEETVYFDDIDDAFAEITADHSVTVTIINGEGDYDDYDDTIAELGFFREGANVKFLAAERRNINGSLIAQYSSAQEAIDADDGLTIICICAEATVSARVTRPMFIKPVGILLDDITINCYLAGYSYVKPDSDLSPTYPGVYQINAQASAATFTWNSSVASGNWDTIDNWVSEDGEVGFVPNNSAWDVVLNTDATITVRGYNIGHISVGAAVQLIAKQNEEVTLSAADGIELTSESASLAITRTDSTTAVELSSRPYTTIEGKGVVWSTSGGTTTYSVADAVAVVDGVNYGSLDCAIEAATAGDTLTLLADGSLSSVGKAVTLDIGTYTLTLTANNALDGISSLRGTGTIALPDGVLPSSGLSPLLTSSDWRGALWIRNYTSLTGKSIQNGTTYGSTSFEPNDYGNINSTVKFTGVKGYFRANNVENYTIQPALELEDDGETPGLLLYNGWGYNSNVQCYTSIRELKGSGTLEADNTTPASSVLLQVLKWDNFTGTLTLPKKTVAFGSTLPVQAEVDGGGCIAVQSGASVEVPAGKTWTVGSGVVVYGNLSLGTGAAIVNTTAANTWIKCGTGKVTLNALGDLPKTPASNWAGTVVIPAHTTNTALELNDYGVAGSTVEIPGMLDGWLKAPDSGAVVINPNLRLTGTMLLDDMSAREYRFQTISGNGSLQVTGSDCTSVSIAKIAADFEGSITNTSGKTMTIATVDLAATPSIPSKVLTTSGTNITVTSVTVGGTPTYPMGATVLVSKDDGVYVERHGTIFLVY